MTTYQCYVFTKPGQRVRLRAASYQEALAALIYLLGGEPEAATYIFDGTEGGAS